MSRFRPALEHLEDRRTPATFIDGFGETQVVSGLSAPTTMEFAPDGRIFVSQQHGDLRVIRDGTLLPTPALHVNVDFNGERGLLGVTVDPNYLTNHFIYIYYTVPGSPPHNRVSRFTMNGDVAVAGSEKVLLNLDNLTPANTNHNGGGLHFGKDGKLYVSVGENGTSSNSQTLANRLGKVLRINSDGSIPTDNPFYSTATGLNRAIWVLGLRNPYTFAVQPGTGRIFIDDVGQNTWEEIDDGIAGSNYGWPITEGPTSDPRFRSPLYAYQHGTNEENGSAITGGTFYNPATANFPSSYTGTYFFADLERGWIHNFNPSTGKVTDFATGISLPVDLRVGPDGQLYYLARGSGAIFRVYTVKADLSWSGGGFVSPASADTHTAFRIDRTYNVSGSAFTRNFIIRYYASTDTTYGNADDLLIGAETLTNASDKSVGLHSGKSPLLKIGRPGRQFLFAVIDASNRVQEASESNNVYRRSNMSVNVTGKADVIIDNGDAGYTEVGNTWQHPTQGFQGDSAYIAAGNGSLTATWQLTGLPDGTYVVQATWFAQTYWATNAPFGIYDGSTLRQKLLIDETKAPVATSTIGGTAFQTILARVTVHSGVLRVVLSNDGNNYAMADAIRIVQV